MEYYSAVRKNQIVKISGKCIELQTIPMRSGHISALISEDSSCNREQLTHRPNSSMCREQKTTVLSLTLDILITLLHSRLRVGCLCRGVERL